MEDKVSISEFINFQKNYDNCKPNTRLGQDFLNKFYPNLMDSELYYEENYWASVGMIYANYLNIEIE